MPDTVAVRHLRDNAVLYEYGVSIEQSGGPCRHQYQESKAVNPGKYEPCEFRNGDMTQFHWKEKKRKRDPDLAKVRDGEGVKIAFLRNGAHLHEVSRIADQSRYAAQKQKRMKLIAPFSKDYDTLKNESEYGYILYYE